MFDAPLLTSCILQGKSGSFTSFIQHKCRFRECLLVLCAVTALSRLNVVSNVHSRIIPVANCSNRCTA